MNRQPKIAIIYLSYHCEPYINDVVSALKKVTYPKDKLELVIVDNPHPKHNSSIRYLEENIIPLSGKELPHVTLLPQKENLGFAGGNNEGIKWAIENDFDYVYFHNNDGFVASNCLEPLVEAMEKNENIGVAQSLMLLHPETNSINSAGNCFHYLGFGFCDSYKIKHKELNIPAIKEINYASGAAILMRVNLLKKYGLWDEDFFLYHEDLEYCYRLKIAGYKTVLVKDSVFFHKYQFSRSITKFFYMERNRYGVMLMFFRWPTLLVLLPICIALEIGLWIFAFKNNWIKERIRVYKYWSKKNNWKLWMKKRKYIQKIRKITDRELLKNVATEIHFQEKTMRNPLLKYIGNPIMKTYYYLIVRLLIWW